MDDNESRDGRCEGRGDEWVESLSGFKNGESGRGGIWRFNGVTIGRTT